MTGIFYGVGVGPGDPELLTVKAINAIREADIIIAPKTEKKEDSTALTIAQPFLKESVKIVKLVFPMVFHSDTLSEAWQINKNTILEFLAAGKKVVFLTLGDPMFYSTYIYIFRLINGCGYTIETIPGVPAFCAIGSKLGYPLVEGNDVLSVIPATIPDAELDIAIANADNIVLMKVYKNYKQVLEKLKYHGFAENAVMISRCGFEDEQVVHNLNDATNQPLNYLSTILARRNKL
ncbi:MAG: precorrin-2 C20-methyltransferase [Firmicutes bacterium]|nr:precorrin-2 C20-methyltransferase [Bacillota bacterium]